jgi:hypothetical protein
VNLLLQSLPVAGLFYTEGPTDWPGLAVLSLE